MREIVEGFSRMANKFSGECCFRLFGCGAKAFQSVNGILRRDPAGTSLWRLGDGLRAAVKTRRSRSKLYSDRNWQIVSRAVPARCTCRGVPTHPRLAIHTDQSPESGQDEQAVLLDLGDGYVGECAQQALRYFLGDLARVCEGLDDLCLCHHDSLIPAYADELMVRQYRTISQKSRSCISWVSNSGDNF